MKITKVTVFALFGIATGGSMLLSGVLSGTDEYERPNAVRTANASTKVPEGVCTHLPDEILRIVAPDANELVIATRLLSEAADPEFAATTTQLQKARDLAMTNADLWKYKAEAAKSEAEWQKESKRKELISSGNTELVWGQEGSMVPKSNILSKGGSPDSKETVVSKPSDILRLKMVNKTTGEMSFSAITNEGQRKFENVVAGAHIQGFKVGQYNPTTRCVAVDDDVVCMN